MTEKSLFFYTNGFTGDVGDGAAPYTQEEFRLYNHAWLAKNQANVGVLPGVLNELAVSGSTSPLSVATGRASVYGFAYWADASVSLAVTTPSTGTTGGRVVLRAGWTAQTVRATVIMSADGTASIPAMTQTPGTTWDIPLATFTITTGGDITLVDVREFVFSLDQRQGGSRTAWNTTGTTAYPNGAGITQAGSLAWTGDAAASGSLAVTFPVEFAGTPLINVNLIGTGDAGGRAISTASSYPTTTGFTIFWEDNSGGAQTDLLFHWFARGPA